ncbi:MAG: LytTR family transcriptional regulator DNA-binding domain-containing protein [Bacteroidales bacterium]|nr:LytTR family transcriptional regulator DNA-binding domain-containing protein [Bacteroidales bacterium]
MNAPKYLLQNKFLLGSVAFVVVFSFLFLFLYHPFSDTIWLGLDPKKNLVPTLLFYLAGIFILILSKVLMMLCQRRRTITVNRYLLWIAAEFVLIATAYLLFASRYFDPDILLSPKLLLRTSYCVALILAIPYTIFTLIAANRDKAEEINALKINLESERPEPVADIIHFYDYTGALKISVAAENIYYIASQDNYVEIRYELGGKLLTYLMRCRTTRLEKQLEGTSLIRCHRSFIVNVDNVTLFKREGARAFLVLSHPEAKKIPVSKSYYKTIAEHLGRIAS